MPRTSRPPAYRLHKARSLAVVTINGKNHYLGPYGSPESHEKYAQLIANWKRNGNQVLPPAETAEEPLLIDKLILTYFRFVQIYYVKHGKPTSEQDSIRQALRFVRKLYGSTPARVFGPKALKNVRQAMIEAGRCRKLINKDVHRLRGMFRWAVEEELLPVELHQKLMRVRGLRKGRSSAKETGPVLPVDEKHLAAVLPHLSPQVAAMVQLQHLCSARSQEITTLRPCEIVVDGDVWLYYPHSHKTEHLDRKKVIVLGPKAQEVLRPWLHRDPEAYCFVPAEASAWQLRRRSRKSQPVASYEPVFEKTFKRQPGMRYTRYSYRNAVVRACKRARVPAWSPRQLRHTRATAIRAQYGIEAAKAVLGHTDTKITEIYAERDLGLAVRVMKEIG
jgi:integrase